MKVNYKEMLAERKQILDLIEWIVDGVYETEYPDGYQFLNVSADMFDHDPERLEAWTYMTNYSNLFFVNQCLRDLRIDTEEGLHFEETVFFAR